MEGLRSTYTSEFDDTTRDGWSFVRFLGDILSKHKTNNSQILPMFDCRIFYFVDRVGPRYGDRGTHIFPTLIFGRLSGTDDEGLPKKWKRYLFKYCRTTVPTHTHTTRPIVYNSSVDPYVLGASY